MKLSKFFKYIPGFANPKLQRAVGVGGGGRVDAGQAAGQYVSQIPGVVSSQLQPYIDYGNRAMEFNEPIYQEMAANPHAAYEDMMKDYTVSKGWQDRMRRAQKAAINAAAAGGYRGTINDQRTQAEMIDAIMRQAEGEHFDRLRGLRLAGLQGNEYGAQRGYLAGSDLASVLGKTLATQGELSFSNAEAANRDRAEKRKMLQQLMGAAAGAYFGGPAGAMAGSRIGGYNSLDDASNSGAQMFGKNAYSVGF